MSRVGGSSAAAKQLTSRIKRCASWQQLASLVAAEGGGFNAIHVSAALTHLAQLQSRRTGTEAAGSNADGAAVMPSAGVEAPAATPAQLLNALCVILDSQLQHMDARGVANAMWALRRLGAPLPGSSPGDSAGSGPATRLLARSRDNLADCDAQQLATLLWACVSARHRPDSAWLDRCAAGWSL